MDTSQLLTRDSKVWNFLIGLSLIVGALAAFGACDPHLDNCAQDATKLAYYGIPDKALPFIRLANLVMGIVAAYAKTSFRPHSEYGKSKMTPDDYKA